MNRYTVNFICKNNDGANVVRSEEFFLNGVEEVIDMVKRKWVKWDVTILWAGIRLTDKDIE